MEFRNEDSVAAALSPKLQILEPNVGPYEQNRVLGAHIPRKFRYWGHAFQEQVDVPIGKRRSVEDLRPRLSGRRMPGDLQALAHFRPALGQRRR